MNLSNILKNEMDEGEYCLTVIGTKEYTASTGTPMVDLILKNDDGVTMRHGFGQTPKGMRMLANLASTMMEPHELDEFEFDHLVGKSFIGTVGKNESGYLVVERWRPGEDKPKGSGAEAELGRLF